MGLSVAYGDDPVVAAGDHCGLAARLYRQRARIGRLHLPGQPQRQGHRAIDNQLVAELVERIVGSFGIDPDRGRVHRSHRPVSGNAPLFRGIRMSEARIQIQDLVVRYGDVAAVNGVSFSGGQGEPVTLLGPSGCGKTTTLRAIAGLEAPSGGSIRIDGTTVYSAAERRNVPAEKRGVSMVFQSYAVWPHMSVFDNVAYGLRVRKMPRAEIEREVARALDLVQMRNFADRSAALLSGGQ